MAKHRLIYAYKWVVVVVVSELLLKIKLVSKNVTLSDVNT